MWGNAARLRLYGDLGTYFQDVVTTRQLYPGRHLRLQAVCLAEAVDSGITTLHAWEHNLQTRAHAAAAIAALRDSGLRGRFSYGPSSDPSVGSSFAQGSETIDLEHVLALKGGEFARAGDLLHLGIACRGAEYSQSQIWQKEYAWAREQSLPSHAHDVPQDVSACEPSLQAAWPRPRSPAGARRANARDRPGETGTPVFLLFSRNSARMGIPRLCR
jgi:cytosine/adenosine deaminase-related metal-dependent hydrolase